MLFNQPKYAIRLFAYLRPPPERDDPPPPLERPPPLLPALLLPEERLLPTLLPDERLLLDEAGGVYVERPLPDDTAPELDERELLLDEERVVVPDEERVVVPEEERVELPVVAPSRVTRVRVPLDVLPTASLLVRPVDVPVELSPLPEEVDDDTDEEDCPLPEVMLPDEVLPPALRVVP